MDNPVKTTIPTEEKAPTIEEASTTMADRQVAAAVKKAKAEEKTKKRVAPASVEREEGVKTVQLLVFSLDKEDYAAVITDVREITEITEVTTIPNAPSFIAGIINLRGKVVVVLNLEERFRLVRENVNIKPKHIIIFEIGEATFGVIVDEVTEVLRIPEANIKPAPEIISSKIKADYLSGVGLVEERLLLLLNFEKVLSEQDLAELAQLAEFHQKKVVKPVKEEEKVDVAKKVEELARKKVEEEQKEKTTAAPAADTTGQPTSVPAQPVRPEPAEKLQPEASQPLDEAEEEHQSKTTQPAAEEDVEKEKDN